MRNQIETIPDWKSSLAIGFPASTLDIKLVLALLLPKDEKKDPRSSPF